MKWVRNFPMYLNFLLGTILPFFSEVRAEMTADALMTTSPSPVHTSNPPTISLSQETTTDTLQVTTFKTTSSPEMTTLGSTEPTETSVSHSPPLDTSTVPPLPTTLPPASYTGTGPDQDLQPSHIDQTEANLCEKDNKKQELVFLIIIGVLIFICLCLVLTVVVMASKLAYLKRRLPNKRLPRTNGDFLSASSLWPAGLDTLQRVTSETTGTGPRLQTSGAETLTAGQAKPSEEASKKLVSEISDRQKQKDTSATPQGNLITDIEI